MRSRARHHRHDGFSISFSWPGFLVFAALVLGGGTRTGLTSDFLVQILALPVIWRFIMTFPRRDQWPAAIMIAAIFALFAWQLWPVITGQGLSFPNTLDAGRTLHAMLIVLVPIALFWVVMGMEQRKREQLVSWFLAGVALNFLFAFIQFASGRSTSMFQPFSWAMKAGFFANENHLATLFVMAVPALVAAFRITPWPLLSLPVIAVLIFFELIVGSHAGVGLMIATAAMSYAFVYARSWLALMATSLAMAIVGWLAWPYLNQILLRDLSLGGNALSRATFARNTLAAIRDHWPWGSGMDTFTLVYPRYEKATGIVEQYANHAHDDWLEVALEGGLPAVVLLAAFLLLVLVAVMRRNLFNMQRAAFLAVVMPLLHSLVDYPLRTLAISCSFALFLAILMPRPESRASHAG